MADASYLEGHFLIAMPGLEDPNFERGVTLLCQHDANGALGVTINRPMELRVGDVLEQLDIEDQHGSWSRQPVLQGGPVHPDRGFVIHDGRDTWNATLAVGKSLALTSSRDILEAIARGEGPANAVLALGYAGWAAGQLEDEIRDNAWLSGPAEPGLIFDEPMESRWVMAAQALGVDIMQLTGTPGHA